ncbi:MAG: oxidoreductase [Bacteroidetes bacterium]|nr:oxidoreductase [Bacteroidota bacterium]
MKKFRAIIVAAIVLPAFVNAQHIEVLQQGKPTSFRGLSVVDDNVAWVSGSKGTIAITNDGGKTWAWQQVKGYEKSDFRGIEAFSDKEAIMMSSGTPAVILKTTDGGETWQEKYRKTDSAYFFDAIDFDTPLHGLVLGDPIQGKFLLLETNDGGETWHPFKNPPDALPGEACFAASGTCLRVSRKSINIVTGGSNARVINYNVGRKNWEYWPLPIMHSKSSQGAFSIAVGMDRQLFVGGDYANDKRIDSVACYLSNLGNDIVISKLEHGPTGFQSSIEYISGDIFLSTGTPGSNITTDSGITWRKIDDASYNVCRKAKKGTLVLLAGDHGKIGILKP